MSNQLARVALRKAKEANATDEEWQVFIDRLNKRIVYDGTQKDSNP